MFKLITMLISLLSISTLCLAERVVVIPLNSSSKATKDKVIDANGKEIGYVIDYEYGYGSNNVTVINKKGYINKLGHLHSSHGEIIKSGVYKSILPVVPHSGIDAIYPDSNCTDTRYFGYLVYEDENHSSKVIWLNPSFGHMVYKRNEEKAYYVPPNPTLLTIDDHYYIDPMNQECVHSTGLMHLYDLLPNDPEITGYFDEYKPPLRYEIQLPTD